MLIKILILFAGNIAATSSIFMIRASELAPGYLAAYRLFLAVLILTPLWFRDMKSLSAHGHTNKHGSRHGGPAFLVRHCAPAGMFLGIHFVLWNNAAPLTLAANATLLVNMVALFMPVVMFVITREGPHKSEVLATALAFAGMILLTFGDISLGGKYLRGNIYAFISMLFVTVYLALSRKNKSLPFWYYIGGVYFFGAVTSFLISFLSGAALWTDRGLVEILPVLGLTLIPTLLGHSLMNWSMRHISSQLVSVSLLTQTLWSGILAWLIYGELPQPLFYPSAGLIILGMVIIAFTHHKIDMEEKHADSLS
ncbi:MAG: DMT family transporter [Salinispira sp.]